MSNRLLKHDLAVTAAAYKTIVDSGLDQNQISVDTYGIAHLIEVGAREVLRYDILPSGDFLIWRRAFRSDDRGWKRVNN